MKVCVTGAGGFIGGHAIEAFLAAGHEVVAVARRAIGIPGLAAIHAADLESDAGWPVAMTGCDAVVHLAARAHVLRDAASDPLALFRAANVQGALRVARAAQSSGVRRFVFVSSIGVNGNGDERVYRATDVAAPVEPYAVSKLEAEQALRAYCESVGMELVIVRPVLVYGPGNPGNFLRLLKLVSLGVPLPLAAIGSLRSYVGVSNLVSLLERCIWHPNAEGQILLAADGEDISLPDLLAALGQGMRKSVRLFAVPPGVLRTVATLVGRQGLMEKLTGSLRVDAGPTFDALEWRPMLGVREGLHQTGAWYVGKGVSEKS